MSVRSWPVQGAGDVELTRVDGDNNVDKLTRSEVGVPISRKNTRYSLRALNKASFSDGGEAERAKSLYSSRAGYIGALTRIQRDVETRIKSNDSPDEVEKKVASYNKCWQDFVSTHDKLLDVAAGVEEREKLYSVYEEQIQKKAGFDRDIKLWGKEVNKGGNKDYLLRSNASVRSIPSSSSSRLSSLSRKRERLAIAQLKIDQIAKKHELAKKMLDLQNESELLEAEMKREEAMLSVSICEQVIQEEREQELDDLDLRNDKEIHENQGNALVQRLPAVNNNAHCLEVQPEPAVTRSATCEQAQFVNSVRSDEITPSNPIVEHSAMHSGSAKQTGPVVSSLNVCSSKWTPAQQHVSVHESLAKSNFNSQLPELRQVNVRSNQQIPSVSSFGYTTVPTISAGLPGLAVPTFSHLSAHQSLPGLAQHAVSGQQSPCHYPQLQENAYHSFARNNSVIPVDSQLGMQVPEKVDTSLEIVKALKQVVATPKIEYMRFDGNPIKFPSFMHNFETCLGRNNDSEESKLQLLIQHCHGKAKEAIEACVNLPVHEGYRVAKETLTENFGKPHIIARAHISKLVNLPDLKRADGSSLLEFARNLESTSRTLEGMGPEYVGNLDHVNTLKELNRKLPMFMRAKWAEEAGKIYEASSTPRFKDFLNFVKKRATLVNNEFGDDLVSSDGRGNSEKGKGKGSTYRFNKGRISLVTTKKDDGYGAPGTKPPQRNCSLCNGLHGVWQCEKFRALSLSGRKKIVADKSLCFKCLAIGHYARDCPKKHFRCRVGGCGKEHHTLLHPVDVPTPKKDEKTPRSGEDDAPERNDQHLKGGKIGDQVIAATGAGESRVCLGVVPVKVRAKNGNSHIETYALLDSGSEVTLCHEELTERLQLHGEKLNFTLTGMTGSHVVESQLVDIVVEAIDGTTTVELNNVRTVKNIPISQDCIPTRKDLNRWPHLREINLHEAQDDKVMLIIGLKENPQLFLPIEFKVGEAHQPVAVRYSLGWTIMGSIGGEKESPSYSVNLLQTASPSQAGYLNRIGKFQEDNGRSALSVDEEGFNNVGPAEFALQRGETSEDEYERNSLEQQIESLWKTDFGGTLIDNRPCPSIEDKRALKMMEDSATKIDGHYQVALPWKSYPPDLPNNRELAVRRCELLKRRLSRDKDLLLKYRTTMTEYIKKGHAEKVPDDELDPSDRPVWYLPHHPVVHQLKPDKVRVVYDCAAKCERKSLNQQLLQGPDEANRLVGVLSRFRKEPVGVIADIEAMFHQVLVDPRDRDVLRFLWWPDGQLSQELEEYRMVKHVFGAKSSPSIADFCLKKTADLESGGIIPEAVATVKKNMYVDDLMKSTNTVEKAITLVGQLRELLARGGFRLTKWCSNRREVLAAIPEEERAKSVVNLQIDRLPTESTLGVKWNVEVDKFQWEISEKRLESIHKKPNTRRGILSIVYSIFDPLGIVAPFTMKAKLLLQMLSRMKKGWDDQIGEAEKTQWLRWLADLPKLADVEVERCFKPNSFGDVKLVELHLFSDASRVGYSAVAYLRLVGVNGRIHCAFVMAKARLAPIREISIPRLELSAAVISVKLRVLIQEELEMDIQRVYHWTDSTSVLKCIFNESKRFHTFESNRLTIIHSHSSPTEWRYVNTEANPADDGSKGVKLEDLKKNDRWLKGPGFLWQEESEWPAMIEVPQLTDNDPEVRKEIQVYTTVSDESPLDKLIQYYSCWWKLKRSVAWLLRYRGWLRGRPNELSKCLSVEEIRNAERELLRRVQEQSFPEVLKILKSENRDSKGVSVKKAIQKCGQSVYRLDPHLKDGVMITGGRLGNAQLDEDMKHPAILPYKNRVTDLIVQAYHEDVGHMGQETVLARLRSRFWIVKGRSAVRQIIRKCRECVRRNVRPGEQHMANLPHDRVTPDKPPFTNVGIDYFGPFEVKQGRSRVKRYGCIFTCLASRAIHVEIAHSMDTDSMINALRRFVSIRGCPERIRSDRGTNFVAASKELKESVNNFDERKINKFCVKKDIQWVFNPPASSHMGGVWERMIRTIRQVLKATLKEQVISDEVLLTFVAEAVNIINSRPLTRNSDSQLDEQPLTPNHLLHLRPSPSLPPGRFCKEDLYCKRAWRQAQYLADLFWRRWTKEYLPTLMERQKWNTKKRNLRIGDIVLVADDNFARGNWPLARVVQVTKSKDGMVRVAKVKTASSVATYSKKRRNNELTTSTVVLTRPVTKLCLLEMDQEEEKDEDHS